MIKKSLSATMAATAIVAAGLSFSAPANALDCGIPALLVNGYSGGENRLTWYTPNGEVLEVIPMSESQAYGDIALSKDGLTVYGVQNYSGVNGAIIDVVNSSSGIVTSTITITGVAADVGSWDGAAILADGSLVIGSAEDQRSFTINLSTGESALFGDMNVNYFTTTGDFANLGDGDELWLVTDSDDEENEVIRVHPDGSTTSVGTLTGSAWGAGRVNDDMYFAMEDGTIAKIAISAIPATIGSEILPVTLVVDTGEAESLWGAAGTHDTGSQECKAVVPTELAQTGTSTLGTLGTLGAVIPMILAGSALTVLALRRRRS